MKITVVGDIHGLDVWKRIMVAEQDSDKIIFIGDYLDSFDIPASKQIENLREIIALKRSNPMNVILLLGNHDFHYLPEAQERYGGYNPITAMNASDILVKCLQSSRPLINITYEYAQLQFSHAGVTDTWVENVSAKMNYRLRWKEREVLPFLRFTAGENYSDTGDDITQSPIWVRPPSLLADAQPVFTQIVGHTRQDTINCQKAANGKDVWFIDTLSTSREYLVIQDKEFVVRKIK